MMATQRMPCSRKTQKCNPKLKKLKEKQTR